MLAGSLLAAIAEASAWRSICRWASSPTPRASLAKPRLAWLGLSGVPRSVRNTRSSSTGRGGWPGSTQRSHTVAGSAPARRRRACWWRWWRSPWTAKGGRLRMALLALDFTGPTASSLRLASDPVAPPGRTSTSTMVSSWRNRTVQAAVHGEDVLAVEPAGLAVFSSADAQLLVDRLDLEWLQLLEEPGADV